jgi:UDP-2,3-diacylglucosamine pyrophosphatase LpxH
MRFLKKISAKKIILVISDLHLGAGVFVRGRRNLLEDFHHDKELVDFLNYYCEGIYASVEVELIINGDFLDFLSVPYVDFFDDEYWSEDAAIEKLKIIMNAHSEVIDGLIRFIESKKKKITYIIGNHDAELVLPEVRNVFEERLGEAAATSFKFCFESNEYGPAPGILIKHGHEYEKAHSYDLQNSVISSSKGQRYFVPPWGSYYVTRIVNKFKEEREFINQIRPIKSFLMHGLIFDTLLTLRFMFANAYYFMMVRFLYISKQKRGWWKILKYTLEEIELLNDYQTLTREVFESRPDVNILVVGHTHEAMIKNYPNGSVFINTGTWTKMFNLDFSKKQDGFRLTFAQINIGNEKDDNILSPSLNEWKGKSNLPYHEV